MFIDLDLHLLSYIVNEQLILWCNCVDAQVLSACLISSKAFTEPVLIAYAKASLINTNAVEANKARGLNFGMGFHLHPYFVYASNEGSGEPAHMRMNGV